MANYNNNFKFNTWAMLYWLVYNSDQTVDVELESDYDRSGNEFIQIPEDLVNENFDETKDVSKANWQSKNAFNHYVALAVSGRALRMNVGGHTYTFRPKDEYRCPEFFCWGRGLGKDLNKVPADYFLAKNVSYRVPAYMHTPAPFSYDKTKPVVQWAKCIKTVDWVSGETHYYHDAYDEEHQYTSHASESVCAPRTLTAKAMRQWEAHEPVYFMVTPDVYQDAEGNTYSKTMVDIKLHAYEMLRPTQPTVHVTEHEITELIHHDADPEFQDPKLRPKKKAKPEIENPDHTNHNDINGIVNRERMTFNKDVLRNSDEKSIEDMPVVTITGLVDGVYERADVVSGAAPCDTVCQRATVNRVARHAAWSESFHKIAVQFSRWLTNRGVRHYPTDPKTKPEAKYLEEMVTDVHGHLDEMFKNFEDENLSYAEREHIWMKLRFYARAFDIDVQQYFYKLNHWVCNKYEKAYDEKTGKPLYEQQVKYDSVVKNGKVYHPVATHVEEVPSFTTDSFGNAVKTGAHMIRVTETEDDVTKPIVSRQFKGWAEHPELNMTPDKYSYHNPDQPEYAGNEEREHYCPGILLREQHAIQYYIKDRSRLAMQLKFFLQLSKQDQEAFLNPNFKYIDGKLCELYTDKFGRKMVKPFDTEYFYEQKASPKYEKHTAETKRFYRVEKTKCVHGKLINTRVGVGCVRHATSYFKRADNFELLAVNEDTLVDYVPTFDEGVGVDYDFRSYKISDEEATVGLDNSDTFNKDEDGAYELFTSDNSWITQDFSDAEANADDLEVEQDLGNN